MIKCIVFDIDGTLIDTEEAIIASLQKILKEDSGQEYPREELTFCFGIPGVVTLKALGVRDIETALARWVKYLDDYRASMKVFDGIESALAKIKELKIKTGIVTSKTREEYEGNFVPFGLADYFDFVVCADDTNKHKPHPEPILKLLELSGHSPEEIIYIGDTKYDKECAESAGVKFGLALWGAESSEGFETAYLLQKPEKIIELITTNFKVPGKELQVKQLRLKNGENAVIRQAEKTDAKALVEYINKISGESDNLTFGAGEFGISIEQEEGFLENTAKQNNAIYLIAEAEGRIIGSLNFSGGARTRIAHTGEFGVSVLKEYWGNGIGTELIKYLIKWSKESGVVRKINLRVRTDNVPAIHVYKKLGFMEEGIKTRDFLIKGKFFDSLCMGLAID